MKRLDRTQSLPAMMLDARTAEDLMTSNPVSIRASATLWEAVTFLTDRGFSAAPVIDEAGRPLGVISRTDLLLRLHEEQSAGRSFGAAEHNERHGNPTAPGEDAGIGETSETSLRDLMTKGVFCVAPGTPAPQVVARMLGLRVHRLFVVDEQGVLIGLISAVDVLQKLRLSMPTETSVPTTAASAHTPWNWSSARRIFRAYSKR